MFSFKKRIKSDRLAAHVRRLCDITTAVEHTGDDSTRRKIRYSRAIPTLVFPWDGEHPDVEDVEFATMQDVSEQGVGLIVRRPFRAKRVLLAYFFDRDDPGQPLYFVGKTRHDTPIGGGFRRVGIKLTAFANADYPAELASLDAHAAKLLPPQEVHA